MIDHSYYICTLFSFCERAGGGHLVYVKGMSFNKYNAISVLLMLDVLPVLGCLNAQGCLKRL